MRVHFGHLAILVLCSGQPGGQQPQKIPPPKWLSDEGKDLFNDVEDDATYFGDSACEAREKLLKLMAGKGGKGEEDATDHRVRVLLGLGLCEIRKSNWDKATLRFESTLSEMNAPSDDALLKNQRFAPFVLMKQATTALKRWEIGQGATQLRRCSEVIRRNIKNVLKSLHKQSEQQQGQGTVPPLEMLTAEIVGYGKTGQYLPMLVKQFPILKQDLQQAEVLEEALDRLDDQMSSVDPTMKDKRKKLDVSKGKSQNGSLMYVRALLSASPGTIQTAIEEELIAFGATAAFVKEISEGSKSGALIKRTKSGPLCESMPETCAALLKIPDIHSNGFGETRVVNVKPGKAQNLDSCTTNANVGVLVAAGIGVSAKIGRGAPFNLEVGKPVVVDFCSEVELSSSAVGKVMFAQAWHPEFAAVERTTELRARAKAFGLSEDEAKAAIQTVNDHAKKSWEKAAEKWRRSSLVFQKVKEHLQAEKEMLQSKKLEAEEAKRKAEETDDDERKHNLAELERKRAEKKRKEEEAEQKRLQRKKQLEAERANRDPWLLDPVVREAEQKLADLKEARRDANAKLEFDLSTQLTKDISSQERVLKKAIKTAKKEHKKEGGTNTNKAAASETSKIAIQKELKEVKKLKDKASQAEDFKEAKRLKDREKELEAQLQKIEL
jgi:hypothetical protein